MSLDSVASNTHGNLDEQISQLMQCKPLSEQEVILFFFCQKFLFLCFSEFFFFNFSGGFWEFSSIFFGEMVWIWLGLSGLKLGIYDKNLSFLFFENLLDYFKGVFVILGFWGCFWRNGVDLVGFARVKIGDLLIFFCFVCVVQSVFWRDHEGSWGRFVAGWSRSVHGFCF
jgi:hypothetical protein